MKCRSWYWPIVLGSVLVTGLVYAKETNAQPVVDCSFRYQTAMARWSERNFSEAITLLQAMRPQCETPELVYNIAVAYRNRERFILASEAFRQALTLWNNQPPTEFRVEERLSESLQAIGSVTVIVRSPIDAVVRIDGVLITQGQLHRLDPGQHVIVVTRDNFTAEERTVNLARGQQLTEEFELSRLREMGRIILATEPQNAEIFLAGRFAGRGLLDAELTPGEYLVAARAQGYHPFSRQELIRLDETTRRTVRLTRQGMSPGAIGAIVGTTIAVTVIAGLIIGYSIPAPYNGNVGMHFQIP